MKLLRAWNLDRRALADNYLQFQPVNPRPFLQARYVTSPHPRDFALPSSFQRASEHYTRYYLSMEQLLTLFLNIQSRH